MGTSLAYIIGMVIGALAGYLFAKNSKDEKTLRRISAKLKKLKQDIQQTV